MSMLNRRSGILLIACLTYSSLAVAENWPTWRGATWDGVSSESDLPTEWDRESNVKWRTLLPEPGNSTPIVWGDHVFVTQPMELGKRRTLICFDRETGKQLWQSGVDAVEMERTHDTNPYCSPSPVTDGERVICWFGSNGLVAFDRDGQQLWQTKLGKADHVFGYGQSPIIVGDMCLLNFGPGTRELAVGVDKHTGAIVWQRDAPQPDGGVTKGDIYGTWSTPILVDDVAVFCFRNTILGLDPNTGDTVWSCRGLGPQMKASPVAGEGLVVALGGKDSSTLVVKSGGTGDVSDTHVVWRRAVAQSRMGTGVIRGEYLYANRRNGIVECLKLQSGETVWEKRLRAPGGAPSFWSSLTLAGDKIYAISQEADVFVMDASPTYQLLGMNSLREHTNSSVSVSQGDLFIRTHEALWCIGR